MVEYKVRPVIRYIVTRFEATDTSTSSSVIGEFMSEQTAEDVKNAFSNHALHETGLEARMMQTQSS